MERTVIVVGVDPGSGVDSPTGLAIFNPDMQDILLHTTISSDSNDAEIRVKDICTVLSRRLEELQWYSQHHTILVVFENFVMRGKGGQVLQRLIGAMNAFVPKNYKTMHVYNTTVKKVVGGHGRADKAQVARGVEYHFRDYDPSWKQIHALTTLKQWDILDAYAIGLTGWIKYGQASDDKK
jgi:Holliday junction resolvasome RuvABC endonuclease subunit